MKNYELGKYGVLGYSHDSYLFYPHFTLALLLFPQLELNFLRAVKLHEQLYTL